ncbi:unnamed protein product, partial [Staurois parvus]
MVQSAVIGPMCHVRAMDQSQLSRNTSKAFMSQIDSCKLCCHCDHVIALGPDYRD